MITLADHGFFGDSGHFFHGLVPCDNLFVVINYKGCIGQEVDDVQKLLPGFDNFFFDLFAFGYVSSKNYQSFTAAIGIENRRFCNRESFNAII